MKAVSNEEAEIGGVQLERPGADVIPLPQLERLPRNPGESTSSEHEPISAAGGGDLDGHSWRLEALELVRSAVELADRIEREAQHSATDRLARADEEVRLRRAALEERELELERVRGELERAREHVDGARRDVELHRRQAIEAEQEAHALSSRAEREAAEKIAIATEHAESILQAARREAQELVEAAHRQAVELLAQNQVPTDAGYIDDDVDVETGDPPQFEQSAEELEEPEDGQYPEREPDVSNEGESAMEGEPELPSFIPPPLSVEDLATVSSLPIFGKLNPLRKR